MNHVIADSSNQCLARLIGSMGRDVFVEQAHHVGLPKKTLLGQPRPPCCLSLIFVIWHFLSSVEPPVAQVAGFNRSAFLRRWRFRYPRQRREFGRSGPVARPWHPVCRSHFYVSVILRCVTGLSLPVITSGYLSSPFPNPNDALAICWLRSSTIKAMNA